MKKKKRFRRNTVVNKSNTVIRENIPFRRKVINLFKKSIFWQIVAIILAFPIYNIIEHRAIYKQRNAEISIFIGNEEINKKEFSALNIIYLMPMSKLSGLKLTGILPITLTNNNEYDIDDCEIKLGTFAFTEEKPILQLTNGYTFRQTSSKPTIKDTRFIQNIYPELANLDEFQRKSLLLKETCGEIVTYQVPHFKAQTSKYIYEEFKIDTMQCPTGNDACKDYFTFKLSIIRKNNKTIDSFDFVVQIKDYISLEDLITNYGETGLLGNVMPFDCEFYEKKKIPNILIYPFYYQEDGDWKVSIERSDIYYLVYDTPYAINLFSPYRKLLVYKIGFPIFEEYKFKDTKEKRTKILEDYEFVKQTAILQKMGFYLIE